MIELQRLVLGDRVRNEALAAALRHALVPGRTTIADLGSGTGYLAFVASRLGAKRCWLYEMSELLELSREIARVNGIRNCTFVHAHSTQVKEPPRADVVISETLGNLALEEGVLSTLADGRRFLAPGGTLIPQRLRQYVAPVVRPRLLESLDVWANAGFGLDLSPARRVSLHNAYVRTVEAGDLMPDARRTWDEIDFRGRASLVRRATVEWPVARPERLFGFALWWECELIAGAPGAALSTAPDAPRTHWEQIWLPPLEPLEARAGDTLRLSLECDARPAVKINLKWRTQLADARGRVRVEQAQDMKRGYLE